MIRLGVNVDHVATLRQARYRDEPDSPLAEPDPLEFALAAKSAGAQGITAHLREDRRHMQEKDILLIRKKCGLPLNLEMAPTAQMVAFAKKIRPPHVCLVPENRQEVTTEGGLDVRKNLEALGAVVAELQQCRCRVSLFIDPQPEQVEAAALAGADVVELHTGCYARARTRTERTREVRRLLEAAFKAHQLGLELHAGHGLNYENIEGIFVVPGLAEVNIGHSIISRAVMEGAVKAVREMVRLLKKYRLAAG
jgi:pyridoxine 5-phosphate synthase